MICTNIRIRINNFVFISKRLKSSQIQTKRFPKKLKFETKVPQKFTKAPAVTVSPTKIDESTINLLEHLSLVDCANKQGVKTLEDAILFADKIHQINTENVEPLYTVLEDSYLTLREDKITDGNIRKDILKNAALVEEDYFVAPPGNIPLAPRENPLHEEKDKNKSTQKENISKQIKN